jgi:hypothetical protein
MLAGALNSHQSLQRYKILFICGRSSSRRDRNFTSLQVRRAFILLAFCLIACASIFLSLPRWTLRVLRPRA